MLSITDDTGTLISEQRYLPFGGLRQLGGSFITQTDYGYTGQRELDSGMGGLMDYKARFYSQSLGRFIQPDSIVPNESNPQAFNRYSYVLNQPLILNDPTGHCWGFVSGLRGVSGYEVTCGNFDQAWQIISNPNATSGQRLGAATYVTVMTEMHVVVAAGLTVTAVRAAPVVLSAATKWVLMNPIKALVGKAIAEEVLEANVTKTAFDPGMVALDLISQFGDDFIPRRYNRNADYGGSATTNNPTANAIRESAKGKKCPTCGEIMTEPWPQHEPPLVIHLYTEGYKMTPEERKAYAQSPQAFNGAACPTCQRREGQLLSLVSRLINQFFGQ